MKSHLIYGLTIMGVLILGSCGGSGDGPALSESVVEQARNDPSTLEAGRIVERADTLLIPAAYFDMSVAAQGVTEHLDLDLAGSCAGTRCTLRGSGERMTIDINDLLTPSNDVSYTRIDLGRRARFDTAAVGGRSRISQGVRGASITATPSATSYGLWGDYGFAAAETVRGPFSGTVEGIPFRGTISGSMSYVIDDDTGTYPTGVGGAMWTGISEAVSTRTYEHRSGSATIRIPDLSNPRVDVDIELAGYQI